MTKDTKFEIQTAMTKNILHPLPSRGDSNLVLSGMQKAFIAIGTALVVIRKRNTAKNSSLADEKREKGVRKREREKQIDDTINEILNSLVNPLHPSDFHESLFKIDPIFHFDVAVFTYEPSSTFTKHTLIQLITSLKKIAIANHDLQPFKIHVGTKILQKTFGKHEGILFFHSQFILILILILTPFHFHFMSMFFTS